MKLLIIQERGRHQANKEFREALNLKRSLHLLGYDSVVWGLNYDNFDMPFPEIVEGCDAIVLLENYETGGWIPDLSKFPQLKLFWSIDSHVILQRHINTCKKHKMNLCLNAIESDQKHFQSFTKTYYYPNAYPHELIYPMPDISKNHLIGFCGNRLNRGGWIDLLRREFSMKVDTMVIGDAMVRAVNSYQIHFNRNISNDLNYRTFETLGCQTLLFTNRTENVETFFKSGHDLIIYENEQDLIEKINYYKDRPEERNQLARNGFENVSRNHTYVARALRLIEILSENL